MISDSSSVEQSPPAPEHSSLQSPALFFSALGGCIVFVVLVALIKGESNSAGSSAPQYTRTYSPVAESRDARIDAYIDRAVEDNWRPIPGGNSKEDAARVSKDIMKARSWEELEDVIEFHSRHGR